MDYSRSWQELRRKQRVAWLVLPACIPVGVVADHFHSRLLFFVLGGLWCAAGLFAFGRVSAFPCPRCRKTYFIEKLRKNPSSVRCLHCGLRKEESSDVVETEWSLVQDSLPKLEWGRLRRFSDGMVEARDADGKTEWFASVKSAHAWLSEDGLVQLSSLSSSKLAAIGLLPDDLAPPNWST